MEVLSAASETVANADAIAAAAAALSAGLPGAAAGDTSGGSSAGTSPRPSNNNDSEIEGEEEAPSMRSRESSSSVATAMTGHVGAVVTNSTTGYSPAARDAHARLVTQAEEIRSGA